VHQQVHVVPLVVHLEQLCLKVATGFCEQFVQSCNGHFVEYFAAILCHKDQVHMHRENTVPPLTHVVVGLHWPNDNRSMKRLQAFKFALAPNGQQQRDMRRFAGACRFVFNRALALQKERHEQGAQKLSYAGLCQRLTEWKARAETGWLREMPSQALQQALKDLERAYANFFARRAAFPRFKKNGQPTASATRKGSSSTRPTAACSCPGSAGCATATAARCWGR
jgi:putative transposase